MFQLSPNNRDQPDEVLLDDLRAVSASLGGRKLTRELYASRGRFAPATVANRFHGWGRALERAGLESPRHFSVSQSEAINDLQRVAQTLGVEILPITLYRQHGKYSEKVFAQNFGGWVNALKAAGLKTSDQFHPRTADEQLFENLEIVWQALGRQPMVNDMFAPRSRFSTHAYKRRFGSWRKALEAFVVASSVVAPENRQVSFPSQSTTHATLHTTQDALTVTSRTRSVGWRLRYAVLSRDHFSCMACGRSPANQPGVALQVDHVVPWSRGGPTIESNLQTLCEQCNGGKGAA